MEVGFITNWLFEVFVSCYKLSEHALVDDIVMLLGLLESAVVLKGVSDVLLLLSRELLVDFEPLSLHFLFILFLLVLSSDRLEHIQKHQNKVGNQIDASN